MAPRKKTSVSKGAVSVPSSNKGRSIKVASGDGVQVSNKLTKNEVAARKISKYATTTFGFNTKTAFDGYGSGGVSNSQQGNFYSPQLSTDFLEKPQNLRERRAWYRHFYNANEYVGQAIDLHSTLPLSKIRLEKPKGENQDQVDYMYDFFVEMAEEMNLTQTLMEISHEYMLLGNVYAFCEDHDPYEHDNEDYVKEIKAKGKVESERLFKEFKITDKDPNYMGWRRIIILPPDQVRIKKIPLSDESRIEFLPDPETRKSILRSADPDGLMQYGMDSSGSIMPPADIPEKLITQLKENGSIPLDTDPYSGSYCYHLARKKSQYETQGVSILERCVNTLLLQDKLRQAQTSIASRHMTPIRIVWAEDLSEADVDNLREQVDLALVDPDYSIIANFQVHWEEMGSNGRLLELSTEYDHIENSLFAGLGVTREILTGEGTYSGNRITLEIMNAQYLLYRELLQNFVENYLFKPVAKKKGFVEKDKYGREKLLYPRLSFSRLAIRDNDSFFDQAFQLYNKGSVSIDVILDMLNIDPVSTQRKIEADLFTTNDFAFNQLMINIYTAVAQGLVEKFDVAGKLAGYLDLPEAPQVPGAEGDASGGGDMGLGGLGAGGAPPMPRFASDLSKSLKSSVSKGVSPQQQAALKNIITAAMQNPQKMDKILKYLQSNGKI
ncbi:MAG: hypothetical protein GF334_07155 [Candidatus Altiarchaeales archaeon]|nr:hypothetical protein [Candidatus Altiarchaeales archaeon]